MLQAHRTLVAYEGVYSSRVGQFYFKQFFKKIQNYPLILYEDMLKVYMPNASSPHLLLQANYRSAFVYYLLNEDNSLKHVCFFGGP